MENIDFWGKVLSVPIWLNLLYMIFYHPSVAKIQDIVKRLGVTLLKCIFCWWHVCLWKWKTRWNSSRLHSKEMHGIHSKFSRKRNGDKKVKSKESGIVSHYNTHIQWSSKWIKFELILKMTCSGFKTKAKVHAWYKKHWRLSAGMFLLKGFFGQKIFKCA